MPRSSRCPSVQCVHFGSIKRLNYLFMASIKKNCWKLMLSEGWKYYFRDPVAQNLPGCTPPDPRAARAFSAPDCPPPHPPPNKSKLATALLNTRETEHGWRKGDKKSAHSVQVYLLLFTSNTYPSKPKIDGVRSAKSGLRKEIQSTFLVYRNVIEWWNGLFKFSWISVLKETLRQTVSLSDCSRVEWGTSYFGAKEVHWRRIRNMGGCYQWTPTT